MAVAMSGFFPVIVIFLSILMDFANIENKCVFLNTLNLFIISIHSYAELAYNTYLPHDKISRAWSSMTSVTELDVDVVGKYMLNYQSLW